MSESRVCLVCGQPIGAGQPAHHWACSSCYFARPRLRAEVLSPRERLAALPGQMTLWDVPTEPQPAAEAESAYLDYEAERDRLRGAA